jgi:hypothetical protein
MKLAQEVVKNVCRLIQFRHAREGGHPEQVAKLAGLSGLLDSRLRGNDDLNANSYIKNSLLIAC